MLVRRFHVKPVDVAVLTQYQAQRTNIERELCKKGENEVTVSTVAAAQGNKLNFYLFPHLWSLVKCGLYKNPDV